jgi:hypothetical protein
MSLWSGIADFGLGVQGYNDYTNAQADRAYVEQKRKRENEVANIDLERIRREDDLAKKARAIASQYGLGGDKQLPEIAGKTTDVAPPVAGDDEGYPMPLVPKVTPAVPATANRGGMMESVAGEYEKAGKFDEAQKIRAALKAVESEGYSDIIKGVAAGEEPTNIAQRFNQKGTKRIVNGEKQGDAYLFQYEDGTQQKMDKQSAQDLGARLGIFKKDITVVPHGAKAIDASGAVVTDNPDPTKADPFKMEEFKADLRDRTERLKASLAHKADGKPREVALAEAFVNAGVAPDMKEALVMATEGKNLSPERFKANIVQKLTTDFSDRLSSANPDTRARAQAELGKMADTVTSIAFPTRGPAAPTKAAPAAAEDIGPALGREIAANSGGAPAKAQPPSILKAPNNETATFTGNYTASGKPIYRAPSGKQYVGE